MKHLLHKFSSLRLLMSLAVLLGMGSSAAWAQTTYKLQQVTSVSGDGNKYVFEQDGYVMNNTVSSNALQCTNSYKTTGLTGTETYVWTLTTSANSTFQMVNVSTSTALTNSSSTNISLSATGSKWAFNFQQDGTVLIQNSDNGNRFLGWTNSTSHAYKAYATSNLASYPHAIKVYQLVEEEAVVPAYTITAQSNNNAYGNVSLNGSVITGTPNAGYRYAEPAYTVTTGTATVEQDGNAFTVTPESDCTVQINFEAIPTYTVTYGDGGSVTEQAGGAGVTLATRSAIGDYEFAGWSEINVSSETTQAPTIIGTNETYYPTDNITLYPVYTRTEGGASSESSNVFESGSFSNDVITWTIAEVVTITQEKSNGGTAPNSSYVSAPRWYSGNLITITPSVSINSISATATSNSYATTLANSNFSNATASADNTEVTITPIDGNSAITITLAGQSRLSSLTINYGGGTTYYLSSPVAAAVERPVITVDETFVGSTTATITCATEGATIYYSYDNENWTEYAAALNITATTTIYAKATKDTDESEVASATTTKVLPTPTVTVSGDLTEDLNGEASVSAGTLTAAVTYEQAAVEGAVVAWSSSDEAIATIDANTGAVTLLATGEVTFTATYAGNNDYAEATGTKTITVIDSNVPGASPENPYSVAAAIEATPASGTSDNVYIRGIVSEFYNTSITGDGKNYRYYISDDGTTTDQLLVYRGKGLNDEAFSNDDDLQIGDEVIIYGGLTTYNSAAEVASGNYVYSLSRKEAATITVNGGTEFSINRENNEEELQLTATANSGATVVFTVDTENTTLDAGNYEFEDGLLLVSGNTAGVIVIKANAPAAGNYNAATEVTITVTVIGKKSDATIVVENDNVAYGSTYTIDDSMIEGGAITVTSSNESVATVSGLTITPVAVGTTTVTVSTAETVEYYAGSETFVLTVTAPEGKTTAVAGGFVKVTSTEDITDGQYLIVYEDGGVAFDGSLETLDAVGNTIDVTINESKIDASDATKAAVFTIDAKAGTIQSASGFYIGQTSYANGLATSEEESYAHSFEIDNDGNANISIEVNSNNVSLRYNKASNQTRFRYYKSGQEAIQLYKLNEANLTATLNATTGYATYCSAYPLDFSATKGYSAWQITDIKGTTISFDKVTGSVKGGTGLFLKGTPGATVTLTSVDSENTLDGNLLEGTLAPTYVTEDEYYGLKGDNFVKVNSGIIPAGKAILDADWIETSAGEVKAFTFIFNDVTTGVRTIETVSAEEAAKIFNLGGQRMSNMQRGINIVNGKKVLVK